MKIEKMFFLVTIDIIEPEASNEFETPEVRSKMANLSKKYRYSAALVFPF